MSGISLREHQVDAKHRILHAFGFPTHPTAPVQGARATVVSATGSGKTFTAASAALDMFPRGRVLVLVPTLDLLVQTAQAWRQVGHRSPMVAVCSLTGDPVLEELGVRATTHPIQLALWAGTGPVIVLATYASLVERDDPDDLFSGAEQAGKVPGPIEHALQGGEGMYGQTMEPFDLAVVDEAHRTAGDTGRPWAAIHDQTRIPAAYRLYLTATPRILAAPDAMRADMEIASMTDDPAGTYGAQVVNLGLGEAIERGILAGFEIDVLEIHDPAPPTDDATEEEVRGHRLGLLQAALLEHAARHDLPTVMTFHHRVEEAKAFAAKLPQTAAALYAHDPVQHMPPHRVWADWLCGDHLVTERRTVLDQFANGLAPEGHRVNRAVLASVRVLGEGVDITGAVGVSAVCFADTRGSQVEIVQNIGRALRPSTDGTPKLARLIVPVFLAPGESPDAMIASASYKPLVAVLQGLRAHDERLVEQLASHALTRRNHPRGIHLRRDEDGHIISADTPDTEDQEQPAESALLRFSTPRDPATIADFITTRVYQPQSLVWLEGLNALRAWRAEHHVTGLYAVPYDAEVQVGYTAYPVGRWVAQQRRTYRAGDLHPHRIKQLEAEGMVWEPGDEAWETKLAALRAYRHAHGHLAPRQDAVWLDVRIGMDLANLRRPGGLGKDPHRAATRAAQLAEIDADWNCPWPLNWQRHYAVLRDLAQADGHLPQIAPGVTFDGDDLGRWLHQQRRDWNKLTAAQQERLNALGVQPAPPQAAVPARPTAAAVPTAFERGIAALTQYIGREGSGNPVPRSHVEPVVVQGEHHEVKLGIWISNTKTRRSKLTNTQRGILAELGITWT
ncbi:Helicase associated domain protein [Streptomyces mauvecolor]|uniref:Helicase associated domain protein n=1 Tax=Streptomyces mauvecolor TaxID=58345 RepID=A0ABV9UIB7_9ACTN